MSKGVQHARFGEFGEGQPGTRAGHVEFRIDAVRLDAGARRSSCPRRIIVEEQGIASRDFGKEVGPNVIDLPGLLFARIMCARGIEAGLVGRRQSFQWLATDHGRVLGIAARAIEGLEVHGRHSFAEIVRSPAVSAQRLSIGGADLLPGPLAGGRDPYQIIRGEARSHRLAPRAAVGVLPSMRCRKRAVDVEEADAFHFHDLRYESVYMTYMGQSLNLHTGLSSDLPYFFGLRA